MNTSEINEDVEQERDVTEPENPSKEEVSGEDVNTGARDIASLQATLTQSEDQRRRQAAEFQNFKRRTETEKRQSVGLGKSIVLTGLLDVFDDLNRSVVAAVDAPLATEEEVRKSFESLKSGVDLAHKKLMDELTKLDVKVIDTVGSPFDEEFHEAVMQQPAPDSEEPGTILTEVQRGFILGDRVLRHAKVIVAS